MNWIGDQNNKKVQQIKNKFREALKDVSKEPFVNYYDFLLIAKHLGFRFQEASHLMALKNHFVKHKNLIQKKKLVDVLTIHQNFLTGQIQDKLIVKFNLPENHFDPIQEVTNEDQQYYNEPKQNKTQTKSWGNSKNQAQKNGEQESQQYKQKIEIIVNIKMDEMYRKINLIYNNIPEKVMEIFDPTNKGKINAIEFKKGIIKIFSTAVQKLKISQDDIKTIFYLLDVQKDAEIGQQQLTQLKKPEEFLKKLREFYKSRVNPSLIKNTEFKKSKLKNNIQIFQVKNPSVLQLEKIQEAVLQEQNAINQFRQEIKKNNTKKPRFGPLKHTYSKKKQNWGSKIQIQKQFKDFGENNLQIYMQRERIQKILKASKEKRNDTNGNNNSHDTIASKLRSLFIHKVILPREKMLQQQKEAENRRFNSVKIKNTNSLLIKPSQKK